jgi:hypothetical protein
MQAQALFSDEGVGLLKEWGASGEELRLHGALGSRTLRPVEEEMRPAAAWLRKVFAENEKREAFNRLELAEALGEKGALVLRMAYRHVPAMAGEVEGVLRGIDETGRLLPVRSEALRPHVEALRRALAAIDLPKEMPPGADLTWHENRLKLKELVLGDDPLRFLTWPVVINSMFMNDAGIARPELDALRKRADFDARWQMALKEDALGAPARTGLMKESSNNLIHHAYNLLQLEQKAGVRVEHLTMILEFGGGYGSTARLAHRLGFKGRYVIFDLPEFSALQRFFLGGIGMTAATGIHCVTSVEELREVMPKANPDLFLATWSLSETPLGVREWMRPWLLGAKHWLIAYQELFGGVENVPYFASLVKEMGGRKVWDDPIGHLARSRYLVVAPK